MAAHIEASSVSLNSEGQESPEWYSRSLLRLIEEAVSAASAIPTGTTYSVRTSRIANAEAAERVRDSTGRRLGAVLTLVNGDDKEECRTVSYEEVADGIDRLLQRVQAHLDNEAASKVKSSVTLRPRPLVYASSVTEGARATGWEGEKGLPAQQGGEEASSFSLSEYSAQLESLQWSAQCPQLYSPLSSKIPRWRAIEQTSLVYVDRVDLLESMVAELKECTAVAIDVEHHSLHSYKGITCLVQLSSRVKDYILDPLAAPFSGKEGKETLSRILNSLTMDPKIIKVLHGANSDVKWLHHDLHVRILNLFDTYVATKVLQQHKQGSLAHILQVYCSVTLDKSFQRADWRLRPLPKKMLHYARSDTHYLLYAFDCLRRDLLACPDGADKMEEVQQRCKAVCMRLTEPLNEKDFKKSAALTAARFAIPLGPRNFDHLVKLLEWRDRLAAKLDEGVASICEARHLVQIAAKEPQSWNDLKSILPKMPKQVYDNAVEILLMVKRQQEKVKGQPVQVSIFSAVQRMKKVKGNKGDNNKIKSADAFHLAAVAAADTQQTKEGQVKPPPEVRAAAEAAVLSTISHRMAVPELVPPNSMTDDASTKKRSKEKACLVGKSVVEVLRKATSRRLASDASMTNAPTKKKRKAAVSSVT